MKRYYIVDTKLANNDTGPEIIQSFRMKDNYSLESPNSINKINRNEFPGFIPDLDYFKLNDKAKITDVVSIGPIYFGFLVNHKVKDLIQSLQLPEYRYYDARIGYDNDKIYDGYFFLHIISDFLNEVDFEKTQFYLLESSKKEDLHKLSHEDIVETKEKWEGSKHLWVKIKQEINSPNELVERYRQLNSKDLLTDKYYFKSEFKINYDLFYLGPHDIRMYASDRAKRLFESEKITGIEFRECSWL